jgi:ubiquitin-protein ligase
MILHCFLFFIVTALKYLRLMAEWRDIKRWSSSGHTAHDAPIILGRDGFEAFPVSEGDLSVWRLRFLCGGGDLPLYANDAQCNFKGACFEADLTFDHAYPIDPPTLKFIEPIPYHPNVYSESRRHGEVCISLLHKAGIDPLNAGETASQRWKVSYGIACICTHVLDLLGHPNMNGGSPADASVNGVLLHTPEIFVKRTEECARLSRAKAPDGIFERAISDRAAVAAAQQKVLDDLADAEIRRLEDECSRHVAPPPSSSPRRAFFDEDDTPSSK